MSSLGNLSGLFNLLNQRRAANVSNQMNWQYQQMLQQANAANDYRYQQGLGELAGLRDRSMGYIDQMGAQQSADIDQDFRNRQARVDQDLARRGMLGSTNMIPAARSLGEGRAAAQNRLAEQLNSMRIGTDASTTGNLTNWIQSRNDQAPEMNSLLTLQQGLGGVSGAAAGVPGVGGGFGSGGGFPSFGHYGPGSGGAGRAGYVGSPGIIGGVGNFGPGSGGAGIGGVFGTGYPGINNGVVSNPWTTPTPGFNNMGPGSGGAGLSGNRRTDAKMNQLANAMLDQEMRNLRQANNRTSGGGSRRFIAATPDLTGSDRNINGVAWQNQDISFGGPSRGGAYGIPGSPVNVGSIESTNYGGMGRMPQSTPPMSMNNLASALASMFSGGAQQAPRGPSPVRMPQGSRRPLVGAVRRGANAAGRGISQLSNLIGMI